VKSTAVLQISGSQFSGIYNIQREITINTMGFDEYQIRVLINHLSEQLTLSIRDWSQDRRGSIAAPQARTLGQLSLLPQQPPKHAPIVQQAGPGPCVLSLEPAPLHHL
jgi:hypothetical protein